MNPEINPLQAVPCSAQAFVKTREEALPDVQNEQNCRIAGGRMNALRLLCDRCLEKSTRPFGVGHSSEADRQRLAAKMRLAPLAALAIATFAPPSQSEDSIDPSGRVRCPVFARPPATRPKCVSCAVMTQTMQPPKIRATKFASLTGVD